MSNLIIDIGSTALKAAWCDGMTIGRTFRYQGEGLLDFIVSLTEKERPEIMMLSSVRSFTDSELGILEGICDRMVSVDRKIIGKYGLPSYISPDRAASIIASRYLFKGKSCTVIDLGTTMTIDFIDEKGNYEGGNISLGCRTRFKALNRYSRNLPLYGFPEDTQWKGTDIQSSIESGVVTGMIFEIEGYLCRYPGNMVVFTGGDAIYFAKRIKNSTFVVCNLVLMGLALIAAEYDKKD